MEIDLEHEGGDLKGEGLPVRAQVCVVGAGIAGLLLAHTLSSAGVDILVLEAGDRAASTEDSSAQQVSALGGTSLVWGGQLLPVLEMAGWPVQKGELQPYLARVEQLLGVDRLPYEAGSLPKALSSVANGLVSKASELVPRLSKFVPFRRRNLGAWLGKELLASKRVRIALRSPAEEIVPGQGVTRAEGVLARTRSGKRVLVVADFVVVAAGTAESCRLLLASQRVSAGGLGNAYGQVGRNYHNHLTISAASFEGRSRAEVVARFRPWIVGGLEGTGHSLKLEPSEALRRRCDLPYGMAHFTFEEPEESGVGALRRMQRQRQQGERRAASAMVGTALRSLQGVVSLQWHSLLEQRRYISREAVVGLRLNTAQESPSSSCIRLSEEVDQFGQRAAVIKWQPSAEDVSALREFARSMQAQLPHLLESNIDGVRWNRDLLDGEGELRGLDDARHAMGGACMGADPRTSVVDGNLRVHGVDNLYVASAAVFPDGRAQLPTLTLMQLSLRLADHLQRELARR